MAQVIIGGTDTFDSLIYGKPHPGTMQFLENQISTFNTSLNEMGKQFFHNAREIYENVSGSEAIRKARAISRQIGSMWQKDEIRSLNTLPELQQAPLTMQRWLMAEPTVRRMFHKQKLDGFSESYVDVHEGDVGVDHYDYRRATDGLVIMDEDPDSEWEWQATTYGDELMPEDQDLMLEEQVDIMESWENIVSYIRAGKEDPTSVWDSDL